MLESLKTYCDIIRKEIDNIRGKLSLNKNQINYFNQMEKFVANVYNAINTKNNYETNELMNIIYQNTIDAHREMLILRKDESQCLLDNETTKRSELMKGLDIIHDLLEQMKFIQKELKM